MKKIISILLIFMLLCTSSLCVLAAETSDFSNEIVGIVDTGVRFGVQNTLSVAWTIVPNKTGLTLTNTQGIRLAYDKTVLQLVNWNADNAYDENSIGSSFSLMTGASQIGDIQTGTMHVYAAKNASGDIGFLSLAVGDNDTFHSIEKAISLMHIRFAFRTGKSEADLVPGSIRLMTAAELESTAQYCGALLNAYSNSNPDTFFSHEYLIQEGGGTTGGDTLNQPSVKYPVSEETYSNPSVHVSSAAGKSGEVVTLSVTLENNPGIASCYLTLKYDENKLTYVSSAVGDILKDSFSAQKRGTGEIALSALSPNGDDISSGSLLFTVTFKINEGIESGVINSVILDYSGAWDGIESKYQFHQFEVQQGSITVNNIIYGDVNGDTIVNPLDVTRLKRYFSGVDSSPNNFVAENANVNGDAVLNPLDVTRLIRYFSGVDSSPLGPKTVSPMSAMSLMPFALVGNAESDAAITVSNATGKPGDIIELSVSLNNNPGIASFYLTMKYDEDKLTYISSGVGDVLTDSFTARKRGTGEIAISALSPDGDDISSGSVLFTVTFEIKEGTEGGIIDDIILDYSGPWDGIESNYQFSKFDVAQGTITVETDVPAIIFGDIFTDGVVDSKDLVKLSQYLAGWSSAQLTPAELEAADVYADGVVDSKDIVKLSQYLAGWQITLGE